MVGRCAIVIAMDIRDRILAETRRLTLERGVVPSLNAMHEWLAHDDATTLRDHVERRLQRVVDAMTRPVPG